MGTLRPTFIVGFGGSAGALNAYKVILNGLPSHTGMAYVIFHQMSPDSSSQLAQILSCHSKMQVTVASEAMPIQANHVYVIPPNANLVIESYTFKGASARPSRKKQIDHFLTSLAEAMTDRAIGIILSGYGSDGTEGCKHIKAKGGITFAQDASAEIDNMPLHAQDSGCVDFVLPPEKISNELRKLVSTFINKKT